MQTDVIVVGAGVAGLAAAGDLSAGGRVTVVLDKSRGVGGRCATRRVEGQAVDHGVGFLHGSDPSFLMAIDSVEAEQRLDGWPTRIHGGGVPCQPGAFAPGQKRFAFGEGITAFPKSLAAGVEVRLGSAVRALVPASMGVRVEIESGTAAITPTVVLALPVEQSLVLMDPLQGESEELRAAVHLLRSVCTLPCLTLVAGYDLGVPAPDWEMSFPEESRILQLVSHDSTKRRSPKFIVLVYQCRPRWSRQHLEDAPDSWARGILDEAARLLGSWAERPLWIQAHRWRYSRTDPASALGAPLVFRLAAGGRICLAGEVFFPRFGGVEAAWNSGRSLARRLLAEGEP